MRDGLTARERSAEATQRPAKHCIVLDPDIVPRDALVTALRARGHEAVGYADLIPARAAVIAGVDAFFVSARVGVHTVVPTVGMVLAGDAGVAPWVVVHGALPAREAFLLARAGAAAYTERDDAASIAALLPRSSMRPPPLHGVVRAYLGRTGLSELRGAFRDAMVRQALALAGGSLSGAARLLGVTRQAVQQFVREALED